MIKRLKHISSFHSEILLIISIDVIELFSNIFLVNSNVDYQVDFSVVKKNGKDYMQIDKDALKLKSENAYYHLHNLFGNQQLSKLTI